MLIEHFEDIIKVSISPTRFLVGRPNQKYELIAKLLHQNNLIVIDRQVISASIPIPSDQVFIWAVERYKPDRFLVYQGSDNCIVIGWGSNACYIGTNEFELIGKMLYHFKSFEYEEEFL